MPMPNNTPKSILKEQIRLLLGDRMIDIEPDDAHLALAIQMSIEKIRQRSDGALLEKDIFLHLTPFVTEYTLPDEVQEIRRLYRRGVGPSTSGGINFDPVSAAFYNTYLLQPNQSGGLATWDFYNQYLETAERVFAGQLNFTWDVNSHKLTIIRKITSDEDISVRCYVRKSEDDLINDPYTGPWIRSYGLAQTKFMIGQARDKFPGGFAGPTGNVVLNGATMKQEAQAEITQLELELLQFITSDSGTPFIIG